MAKHAAPAVAARDEARNAALAPTRKRRPPVRLLETDWSTERGLAAGKYVPSLKRKRQQPPQPDADTPARTAGRAQPAAPAATMASPTARISARNAAPCAPRRTGQGRATPHEGACCRLGQDNIRTCNHAAQPAIGGDAAAARVRIAALRKQARVELAAGAGCSRAVPQHAVALLASSWDSDAAVPGRGGVIPANDSARITRPHVTARCWRHHAEQRGCARAVSRAAVMSMVGLLTCAGNAAEPSQVRLPRHLLMPPDAAMQTALSVCSPARVYLC